MKQPLIFLVIIILLIISAYLAITKSPPEKIIIPAMVVPTATPRPNSPITDWQIFKEPRAGLTARYPSSVLIKASLKELSSINLTDLENWYLSQLNSSKTFKTEMAANPQLNVTQLSGRKIISLGDTTPSGIYFIENYFYVPGNVVTLRIDYGPQPTGISPDFANQSFETNRLILSNLKFDDSASLSSNAATEIVTQIPEVDQEIRLLASQNIKTVLYAESQPSDSDPSFTIYFGESYADHNVRLATFVVDSFSGQLAVIDLTTDKNLTYAQWQKNCSLTSCQK